MAGLTLAGKAAPAGPDTGRDRAGGEVRGRGLLARHLYEVVNGDGERLQDVDLSQFAGEIGPMVLLSRTDLIELLHSTTNGADIRMGTTVSRLGLYPTTERVMCRAGMHKDHIGVDPADLERAKAFLRERFADFIASIAGSMADARAQAWSKGRVLLCGDAAVGFMPTAGADANTAMRSAGSLADELSRVWRDRPLEDHRRHSRRDAHAVLLPIRR